MPPAGSDCPFPLPPPYTSEISPPYTSDRSPLVSGEYMHGETDGAEAASCPEALETLVVRESPAPWSTTTSVVGAAPSSAATSLSHTQVPPCCKPACRTRTARRSRARRSAQSLM